MTKRKHNVLTIAILLLSLCGRAQHHYTAPLDTVKATGFYQIAITPELSSYLKADLSDFRIVDEKRRFVPFVIDMPYSGQKIETSLFNQKVIKKETSSENTVLVIENENKYERSNFFIQLKSAAAERVASLSGSDDSLHWFVILDSLLLQRSGEYDPASHSQRVNFPNSDYKYFRFIIHNGRKEPLNILKVSSAGADSPFGFPDFIFTNPSPAISQTDSAGYSLVKITSDRPYHINKIKIAMAGPWFYKRQAKLFTGLKPDLSATWNSPAHTSFILSSDEFDGYTIPFLKSQVFYLLIENGDNPPLQVKSITSLQLKRMMVAQLEEGVSYSILLDDPNATAPNYDLEHFREKITAITSIGTGKITALPLTQTAAPKKQVANWWIWPVILLIVLLLAVLVWKLTTDMKKGQ